MASVVVRDLVSSSKINLVGKPLFTIITRNSVVPKKKRCVRGTIKYRNLISSDCQSLADRGFLRFQKPFNPPVDAEKIVTALIEKHLGSEFQLTNEVPNDQKFLLLEECFREFDYGIPNSSLHKIVTGNDIVKFYTTPINTKTPYEELIDKNLPPNLYAIQDYVRFDPETDTRFGGITAFNFRPTVVTNIAARKKYKSNMTRLPAYYYNEARYSE